MGDTGGGAARQPGSHLHRSDAWNELRPGDAVRLAGIRGGHWRYRCHVLNERSGATWVEVTELDVPRLAAGVARAAGSRPDARNPPARRLRSFAPERVIPLRRPGRRRRPVPPGQGVLELDLAEDEPAPDTAGPPPARPRRARPTRPDIAPRLFAVEPTDART
ncbi:MAG: hypothetical protein M0T71_14380 [Actinomycetota bacterium]|nr:hypothetical protein [Actinomycetota bacterium]